MAYADIIKAREHLARHLATGGQVEHLWGGAFGDAVSQAAPWVANPIYAAEQAGVNKAGLPEEVGSVLNPMGYGEAVGAAGDPRAPGKIGSENLTPNSFVNNLLNNPASALTAKNGFQATAPTVANTDYSGAIGSGQNAVNNAIGGLGGVSSGLSQVGADQRGLAAQLAQRAAGGGPNPALDQMRQGIDQANAQEAGAIASAKGINPVLAAELASRNTAANNQANVRDASQLAAQQQIAAQSQLAQQQQAEAGTFGAQAGITQAQGSLGQGLLATGVGGQNTANNNAINASLGTQGLNEKVAGQNAQLQETTNAGLLNAAGGVAAKGGGTILDAVTGEADGGEINGLSPMVKAILGGGPDYSQPPAAAAPAKDSGGGLGGLLEKAAPVAVAALSGGGQPVDAKALTLARVLLANGGTVPGNDKVPGKNSPKNDVVPAALSPHEIVLPLSVTEAPDAPAKAAAFVEAIKKKAHPEYGHVLKARANLAKAEAKHRAMGGCAA